MVIAAIADLKVHFDPRRVASLLTEGDDAATANATTIIATVEGRVKNLLSNQYTTTELEADAGIKGIVVVLAMAWLEMRRGNIPPRMKEMQRDAEAQLQALVSGEAKLADVAQLLPSITPSESVAPTDVFEDSGYFDGLKDPVTGDVT